MKKLFIAFIMLLTLCGCQKEPESLIDFKDDELYAVAYLGYQEMDFKEYEEKYDIKVENIMTLSNGDYYLIIPRYQDMRYTVSYYDITTDSQKELFRDDHGTSAFVVQCNVSDIVPDAIITFIEDDKEVSFSPFISLKDGSLDIGERGKNITIGE